MELEFVIEKMQTDQDVKNVQQALKLFYLFDKAILKTKKIQIKDTILLVGSPRSGTTWLMEIFESIPEYTNLFEPFNPIFFPDISRFGFSHKPYVPVNASWPDCENYLKRVLTGKIYTLLPQYKLNLGTIVHRLTNKKLIVKAINLNRLLPWIVNKFQIRNSYFIIRHPCAVIASQLKTGFCGYHSIYPPYINMFPTKDQIIQEANNIDFLGKKILAKLNKIKSMEEILAVAWCLDNIVPLFVKKPYPWTTIVYEKLVLNKQQELTRILKDIGVEKISNSVIQNLKSPSMLTLGSEKKVINDAEKQLSKWKKSLSQKQINQILKIVSIFDLDFYTEDIEPDYNVFNI